MPIIDVRTVIISQLLTDLICTAVLISSWLQNRERIKGAFFWVLDFGCQTTAMLLVVLRGYIPDWISIGFVNILTVGGAFLGYLGLLAFLDKKYSQIHNYILLILFAAVHFYFMVIAPNLVARSFNISIGLLVICGQCAWLLLHAVEKGYRHITYRVGGVFAAFCIVSLIRLFVLVLFPQSDNAFITTGLYDTLIVMSYQLLLILLTFSLTLMVNQQLVNEVKDQEERFSKAFRSSPYAITLTRPSDGKIVDYNQAFLNLTGYSALEVAEKSTIELNLWVNDIDREEVVSALSQGKHVQDRIYLFRKKSGDTLTGQCSFEVMNIKQQRWILSSINDISLLKQAEQEIKDYSDHLEELVKTRTRELKTANERLFNQEKLAVLGQMAGSVGHELRKPLSVMSTAIYFLKMVQPDASDKVKEYLDILEKEAQNSNKIITDLLDFARPGSGSKKPIHVAEVIHKAINRFPVQLPVQLKIKIKDDLPQIDVDEGHIVQVLGNILLNACQAMPDGGKITLDASTSGGMVKIMIQDTGPGIPLENMNKLFEPLFTTKKEGIGLGLPICQKLMEANGGRIEVESEIGKGSNFLLFLPIYKEPV